MLLKGKTPNFEKYIADISKTSKTKMTHEKNENVLKILLSGHISQGKMLEFP